LAMVRETPQVPALRQNHQGNDWPHAGKRLKASEVLVISQVSGDT
jgi:hypothetical protein